MSKTQPWDRREEMKALKKKLLTRDFILHYVIVLAESGKTPTARELNKWRQILGVELVN